MFYTTQILKFKFYNSDFSVQYLQFIFIHFAYGLDPNRACLNIDQD